MHVRGAVCRLTIDGFYYMCFDRETGRMHGYYFDPMLRPPQKLDLVYRHVAREKDALMTCAELEEERTRRLIDQQQRVSFSAADMR